MTCRDRCQKLTAIAYGIAIATMVGMGMQAIEAGPVKRTPGTAQPIAPPSRVSTTPSVAGDKTGNISSTWDR